MNCAGRFWKVYGGATQHRRKSLCEHIFTGSYSQIHFSWDSTCKSEDESFGHVPRRPAILLVLL